MRITRPILFAGVAIALVGVTAVSAAEKQHVLIVHLPDGQVEQIRYTGDVAPRIVLAPAMAARDEGAPMAGFLDSAFGGESPFAQMDRISAEMDRQAAAMMQQVSMAAARPAQGDATAPGGNVQTVVLGAAPAGAHYSYVSTSSVNGKTCTTSVKSVSQGAGKPDQLLRKVSGDCSAVKGGPATPIPAAAPAPAKAPAASIPVSAPAAPKAPLAPKAPPADTI